MDGLTELYRQWQAFSLLPGLRNGRATSNGADTLRGPTEGYEPPRITVIGNVRDLTGGSASNGKSDANSQYYW